MAYTCITKFAINHQIDEIPNEQNIISDRKHNLLINETKEFIPKSFYESKSYDITRKGEQDNYIKYDEESLHRTQTFNFDKLSENNRFDVKMIDRPLLNQEELHFKKSNISFIFETENSLKGDTLANNNNFPSNSVTNLNLLIHNNELSIINDNNIKYKQNNINDNNIYSNLEGNSFSNNFDFNNNNNFIPFSKDRNITNDKKYTNNFSISKNIGNNMSNNNNEIPLSKNLEPSKEYLNKNRFLKEEDIILKDNEKKVLLKNSFKSLSIEKKSSSVVITKNVNLEENNIHFNIPNLNSGFSLNKVNSENLNYNPVSISNRNTINHFPTTNDKNKKTDFLIKMDSLNIKNKIDKSKENQFEKNIADNYQESIFLVSGKNCKKNGSSNNLQDEMISDRDINIKQAFNIENTNLNEINSSNNFLRNEINIIAYNSGNTGEIRPKRYFKNNVYELFFYF